MELLSRFESPFWHALGLFGLVLATLATNLAANVVGPADVIANLSPRHISFRINIHQTQSRSPTFFSTAFFSSGSIWLGPILIVSFSSLPVKLNGHE